jgi:hypothetical protein
MLYPSSYSRELFSEGQSSFFLGENTNPPLDEILSKTLVNVVNYFIAHTTRVSSYKNIFKVFEIRSIVVPR